MATVKFTETPNLLELAEASQGTLPVSLVEHSHCGDEGNDVQRLTDLAPCADEPAPESDIRLKTDIEQVGTTVYGLPLYHFRYKTGTERFEGVMAQDVLEVMPDAVVTGEDGYYRVKYRELGTGMTRV